MYCSDSNITDKAKSIYFEICQFACKKHLKKIEERYSLRCRSSKSSLVKILKPSFHSEKDGQFS